MSLTSRTARWENATRIFADRSAGSVRFMFGRPGATGTCRRDSPCNSVIVTLPPTTFGEPSTSFAYRMEGAVAADGRGARALDEGVTRFAPGESKRHVFDFHMFNAAGSAGCGLGP